MLRFQGKVALVTGAGAGIGKAIAASLAAEGARVLATDLSREAAEATADEINALAGEAIPQQLDVTDPMALKVYLASVTVAHQRLDVLVNNAGINVRSDFRHLADADWLKIRETNLDSVVRLSRDAFDLLRRSGNGAILNLSSIMASRSMRQLAAYSATKGAVASLSRALAVEYAPYGIRVNYLCPGFIETALTERVLRNPAINKALIDQTPLRRFGSAEDVAKAALFLCSDDASFITGEGLAVDGGMAIGL